VDLSVNGKYKLKLDIFCDFKNVYLCVVMYQKSD
jgi:hypothetical protein